MATFCCRNVCSFTASFFFFFFAFLSLSSHAADTLTSSQSIRDGETLISANSTFELGFFSPRNSTNRYVGIWFYNISEQTTVWIANRENPLSDSSGVFRIDESGNLIISNGRGIVFWSANITSNSSIAQLKDTGNLVIVTTLALDAGRLLWQSFDHPTETFLPGMEIGLNLRTGVNQIFTSWKSSNDPSAGNFTLGVDPLGSVQIFMWRGSKPRWRSGEWNGQVFTGVPNMRFLYLYGFNLNNDVEGGRRYFTFAAYNSSRVRFETTPEGLVRQMLWDEENERWAVSWQQPLNVCDVYGTCGPFGSCNILESPMCSCLEGFVPRNGDEWGAGNWTGGCVRRTELGCGRNISGGESDGFLKIDGVKLPDKSDWRVDIRNIEECQASCLNNCTCRAYAYVSGIGCMKWGVDLIDIQKFSGDGNDLYVRLAGSEIGGERSNISMIIIIVIIVVGLIFSVTCIYIMWRFRAKLKGLWKKEHVREASIFDLGHSRENHSTDISGPSDLGEEGKQGNTSELPVFSFNYVAVATNKFSDSNKLGEGGFGAVYKGKLTGGEEIAVKRLSTKSGQGREEFMNEAILIAKLQHRNLVRLLGCCIQWEEKMLIYEYMPNKSLDSFIFDPAKQGLLDWKKRFNIIEGIARGLLYLHRDSRLRIIHRDLKASNILLDEEMNPKISDFGMAKIFGGDQNHANTNRVVGTYGYMSPEYAMEGLFSVKSDVYSFGVLLLEIVSGKKNTSFHNSENYRNLLEYAWKLWKEDKALELIDPSLGDTYSIREVLRCIHVGLLCVQDHTMDRPTMSSVVLMLESELAAHPTPSQPTFSMRRSPTATTAATSSLEQTPENFSTNDVTISVIVGR